VAAIVRPESVALAPADGAWVTVSARVTDIAYLGPHVSCVVETPDGGTLSMTVPSSSVDRMLDVGDRCEIGWPQAAMWVLSVDPEGLAAAELDAAPAGA
jgi:ABC-type Fe3+/spermidine/putrescine transport system ATPase subunit